MQSCAVVDNVISYFHSQLTGKTTPEQAGHIEVQKIC